MGKLAMRVVVFLTFIVVATADGNVTFMAVGDWGFQRLPGQNYVARAMNTWASIHRPTFIVSPGSNFYPHGVSSTTDVQFSHKWSVVYRHGALFSLPWYLAVGRHDYGSAGSGAEWHQVAHSLLDPRWVLPHLWYSFYKSVGETLVHFVVIDTECLRRQTNNHTVMLDWLRAQLVASRGHWTVVVGDGHVFSAGAHGPVSAPNIDVVRPLLEQHGVDVYLSGYDHNLQHIHKYRNPNRLEYVVSGAGGAALDPYDWQAESELVSNYNMKTAFIEQVWGFVGFVVSSKQMRIEFVDEDGVVVYTHTRYRRPA